MTIVVDDAVEMAVSPTRRNAQITPSTTNREMMSTNPDRLLVGKRTPLPTTHKTRTFTSSDQTINLESTRVQIGTRVEVVSPPNEAADIHTLEQQIAQIVRHMRSAKTMHPTTPTTQHDQSVHTIKSRDRTATNMQGKRKLTSWPKKTKRV